MKKTTQDIETTYMKVFRFLADILTDSEFESLSYYHVSRFIGNILHLKHYCDVVCNPQSTFLDAFVETDQDLLADYT